MSSRALVLGGGGAAGSAWETGVIAGLHEADVDLTGADLIVGTSAGSTVAVQVTNASPDDLLRSILSSAPPPQRGRAGAHTGRASVADLLERTSEIISTATDPADMRRRLGAAALELDAATEQQPWREVVAGRLPAAQWPAVDLQIVVVDAHTGEPMIFDRRSGVDVVDAVAASTAGPGVPPVAIGGRRYLDGGYRAGENADLAAGFDVIVVLAPFGGRTRMPLGWGIHLAPQVDRLRAAGSRVETVFPDEVSRDAFGETMMELATRAPAARAGYEQGIALAANLADIWI